MKCSICGKEIKHPQIPDYFGNNPWPVRSQEEDRCCDECNSKYVIPMRIMLMGKNEETVTDVVNKLNTMNVEALDVLLDITSD